MQPIPSTSFFHNFRKPCPGAHHITEVDPRIRALAAAIARDEDGDAEQLVQIAFEIALRRLATFQPGKGLSSTRISIAPCAWPCTSRAAETRPSRPTTMKPAVSRSRTDTSARSR